MVLLFRHGRLVVNFHHTLAHIYDHGLPCPLPQLASALGDPFCLHAWSDVVADGEVSAGGMRYAFWLRSSLEFHSVQGHFFLSFKISPLHIHRMTTILPVPCSQAVQLIVRYFFICPPLPYSPPPLSPAAERPYAKPSCRLLRVKQTYFGLSHPFPSPPPDSSWFSCTGGRKQAPSCQILDIKI